jgi:hypothetical protein
MALSQYGLDVPEFLALRKWLRDAVFGAFRHGYCVWACNGSFRFICGSISVVLARNNGPSCGARRHPPPVSRSSVDVSLRIRTPFGIVCLCGQPLQLSMYDAVGYRRTCFMHRVKCAMSALLLLILLEHCPWNCCRSLLPKRLSRTRRGVISVVL